MKTNRRWRWALLLIPLLLIGIWARFRTPVLMQGSTYSRAPSGYGAWYADLQRQGIAVKRWQRPFAALLNDPDVAPLPGEEIRFQPAGWQGMTMVRIAHGLFPVSGGDAQGWVERGNVLVLVGVQAPVSSAPFTARISSPAGIVKVETRRRSPQSSGKILLKDKYGTVAWQQPFGRGKIITVVPPHLAANAYQDEPGNFKFLTQLVTTPGNPIWIDEYWHGYRDPEAIARDKSKQWIDYLSQPPVLVGLTQALVLLAILLWDKNQRLGQALQLLPPKVDNSEAYIQAMAGVLQKANCGDFVRETIGKAELAYVQRSLGFGADPVAAQVLLEAWVQQTGRSAAELEEVLRKPPQNPSNSQELLTWLGKVQTLHRQFPPR